MKKFERLFVYAYFENDKEDGVHETLLLGVTKNQAIKSAQEVWTDADQYKVSDVQLSYPYGYLFEKDRSAEKVAAALVAGCPSLEEIKKEIERLDILNGVQNNKKTANGLNKSVKKQKGPFIKNVFPCCFDKEEDWMDVLVNPQKHRKD